MSAPLKYDLTGKKFNRLIAVQHLGAGKWLFKCDCGRADYVCRGAHVARGDIKSCGCFWRERASAHLKRVRNKYGHAKHGHCRGNKMTKCYRAWVNIKNRCNNPADSNYGYYGGKGIKSCERWDKFENFLEDMGEPSVGTSIDRINPFGDYEPKNCRWASDSLQNTNKKSLLALACLEKMQVDIYQLAKWLDVLPKEKAA